MRAPTRVTGLSSAAFIGLALLIAASDAMAAPLDPGSVSINVQIGSEAFNGVALSWREYDDLVTHAASYGLASPVSIQTADSLFSITNAWFDPDPVLLFSLGVTNISGSTQTYSFTFSTPLSPTLIGIVSSHAELGLSLTDGLNDGATVGPPVGQSVMLKSHDLYGDGTLVPKYVDIGGAYSIFSGTGTTTYSADSSLTCVQACVSMASVLSFTLTAQDSVGFSGKVVQTVTPVPLPAATWLLTSGLVLLGAAFLRRNGSLPIGSNA